MTIYESSIYAGLKRLIKLIYTAKFLSTKADRINYIEPNIRYLEMSLCKFIMAFNCQENRRYYMDECIGSFGVFRVLFEQNKELGIIHFIRKKDSKGKVIDGNDGISSEEIEMIELIGKIEKALQTINSYLGICKNTCGYNQALKIVGALSECWNKYIVFNTHRCCLEALTEYNYRNRVIIKYKLYEKTRKRRAAPSSK